MKMASSNYLYQLLRKGKIVRHGVKWNPCNCKYSSSRSGEHGIATKEEVAEVENEIKSIGKGVNTPPLSYLGLGIGQNSRLWRHILKKTAAESQKPREKPSDYVPASVKLTWKYLPSEIKNKYPEIESYLKDEETVEEKVEESPVQYPFQVASSTAKRLNQGEKENDVSQAADCKQDGSMSIEDIPGNAKFSRRLRSRNMLKKYEEEATSMYLKHRKFFNYLKELESEVDDERESQFEHERQQVWTFNYGVPDPNSSISRIPCGGCGALLHCTDTSLPGYMPSEKFKLLTDDELRNEQCQRCLYIQHFNVALKVNVDPDEYPKIISQIKKAHEALVVLMVDLLDFPCSIWPGIVDIIGKNHCLVVVGNKVDLLPKDRPGYLDRIKVSLTETLKQLGVDAGRNLKHVALISAKTGYGVENLITALQAEQMGKDVYLVGCTNVGKSTLFNALLQSDFCKVRAVDLVQRATISPWPGTTLNLLKFPILRPTGWRHFLRVQRLTAQKKELEEEEKVRKLNYKATRLPQYATLIGRIGMTFYKNEKFDQAMGLPGLLKIKGTHRHVYKADDPDFIKGHFCYDTPGAVYKDQILDLLTAEEMLKVVPKQIITPRTFSVRPLQTLFIAGLARIDVIEGGKNVLLTVFASEELPIHLTDTADAEKFYECYLGTPMLMVPKGGKERLKDFPPLKATQFQVTGTTFQRSCADIILSSVGWVAIAAECNVQCTLKAYTPDGRGCHLRDPPISPFSVMLKGRRIKGTPSYENKKFAIVM